MLIRLDTQNEKLSNLGLKRKLEVAEPISGNDSYANWKKGTWGKGDLENGI